MATDMLKLKNEVTQQQVTRLAKVEGLIRLKHSLQEDLESAREIVGEMIEQRREEALAVGIQLDDLDAGLNQLIDHFAEQKRAVESALHLAIKQG